MESIKNIRKTLKDKDSIKNLNSYEKKCINGKVQALKKDCISCKLKTKNKQTNIFCMNCVKKIEIENFNRIYSKIRRKIKQRFLNEAKKRNK